MCFNIISKSRKKECKFKENSLLTVRDRTWGLPSQEIPEFLLPLCKLQWPRHKMTVIWQLFYFFCFQNLPCIPIQRWCVRLTSCCMTPFSLWAFSLCLKQIASQALSQQDGHETKSHQQEVHKRLLRGSHKNKDHLHLKSIKRRLANNSISKEPLRGLEGLTIKNCAYVVSKGKISWPSKGLIWTQTCYLICTELTDTLSLRTDTSIIFQHSKTTNAEGLVL